MDAAERTLTQYWDGYLPVRPERLAQQMNVRLIGRGNYGDYFPYSGYFSYEDNIPTIAYNVNDALVRRRFTVAHELGHFLLGHRDVPRDYPDSFGSRNFSPIEVQANQFAAELLMPADVVRDMALSGYSSLDQLADVFSVSKVAMGHRLSNLSLSL
jgi:Zn-dependent peptidase ImmA (M78 family)